MDPNEFEATKENLISKGIYSSHFRRILNTEIRRRLQEQEQQQQHQQIYQQQCNE